jgi:hypothetical protein
LAWIAGGPFVDRQDARVAVVLRGAGFLDEPHAAMDLHAGGGNFDRHLGRPALDDRHQVVVVGARDRTDFVIRVPVRDVVHSRRDISEARAASV